MECDQHVEKALAAFEVKVRAPEPDLSRLRSAEKRQQAVQRHHLEEMTGTDLTKLPGLDLLAVQRIVSEIGLDMSRSPGEKHFLRMAQRRSQQSDQRRQNPFQQTAQDCQSRCRRPAPGRPKRHAK